MERRSSTSCGGRRFHCILKVGCKLPACIYVDAEVTDTAATTWHAVIKDFCKQLGVDNKQVQGVIRLAKKNGEKLGFLA